MAGNDNILFNLLERATSPDWNNVQAMEARSALDRLRYGLGDVVYPSSAGSVPTFAARPKILGGLEVSPTGSDVTVAPGALLQDSAILVPAPGPLDSTYRLGVNRAAELVSMPSPGADSWVLIEGQMENVVTATETRPIFDEGAGAFVPTPGIVKQQERQVAFQITTLAGSVPPFTGGDWVPLAVVFRPGGGGSVLASHIFDIRPLWTAGFARENEVFTSGLGRSPEARSKYSAGLVTASSDLIDIEAEAYSYRGERLWYGGLIFSTAPFIENGFANVASTFRFIYLAPYRGGQIRNFAGGNGQGNCLVILSAVAPNASGRNSGAITPAAPWSTAIPAGDAMCVGAVLRDAANTGWVPAGRDAGLTQIANPAAVTTLAPPVSGDNAVNLANFAPPNARSVILDIDWLGAAGGGAGGWAIANVRYVTAQRTATSTNLGGLPKAVDDGGSNRIRIEVPIRLAGSLAFDLTVSGGAVNAGSGASVYVVGWRW